MKTSTSDNAQRDEMIQDLGTQLWSCKNNYDGNEKHKTNFGEDQGKKKIVTDDSYVYIQLVEIVFPSKFNFSVLKSTWMFM